MKPLSAIQLPLTTLLLLASFTSAVDVRCDFTWPQKIIVEGTAHTCPLARPYCYNPGVSEGRTLCCRWSEAKGYEDCAPITVAQCPASCPPGYVCGSDGVCRSNGKTCTETDSGRDYGKKGTVVDTQTFWQGSQWTDVCNGKTLTEFYCLNDNVELEYHTCPYGCESGACKKAPNCSPPCPAGYACESDGICRSNGKTCTETGDSGLDYEKKGVVTDTQTSWQGSQWTDVCNGNTLTEFYCTGDNVQLTYYPCAFGCENGACKKKPVCSPPCPTGYACESDGVCRSNGKTCTETGDIGRDYMKKGTVTDTQTSWQGSQWTDVCNGNTLTEFYCDQDNVQLEYFTCPGGCANGACKTPTTCSPPCPTGYACESDGVCRSNGKTCTETDSGRDFSKKGTVTDTQVEGWVGSQWTDYCDNDQIVEYYCQNDNVRPETLDCRYSCVNGSCTQGGEVVEPLNPYEPDDLEEDSPTDYVEEEQEPIQIPETQHERTCIDDDGPDGYTTKAEARISQGSTIQDRRTDACASDFGGECPGCVWEPNRWYCGTHINTAAFTKPDCKVAKKGEYLVEYYCDQNTNEIKPKYYDCSLSGKICHGGACQTCRPQEKKCDGLKIMACNAAGTAWTLQETCAQECMDGACWYSAGSRQSGACTGTPKPCFAYTSQQCEHQSGCWVDTWLFFIKICTGTPLECSYYHEPTQCTNEGCTWTP